MKMWELERYDWASLRAADSAVAVPDAIAALVSAVSEVEANAAYWRIDNVVVVQGALYEAALPTTRCLTIGLHACTTVARPHVLELLVQLASGEPHPDELAKGNSELAVDCAREIITVAGALFDLLEKTGPNESDFCVDLLGICAERYPELRERVCWYLRRFVRQDVETGERKLVSNWLDALEG